MNSKTGLVFNIQRFSIHDGPGMRTTVFLKGCPLRCGWCSNPESWHNYPEIWVFNIRCNKCGKCVDNCHKGAITLTENGISIDRNNCDLCFDCVNVCPTLAIEKIGSFLTVNEIMEQVNKDIIFYENSGGGVTVSGGEPLYQPAFLLALLKSCKEKGLHTTLDTSGYSPWDNINECLHYLDLVLIDVKSLDPSIHYKHTGVSNELILDNINKITGRVKTWLRVPVIPGVNTSESQIKDLADFAIKLSSEKLCLLPLHHWGKSKYTRLGRKYLFDGVQTFEKEYLLKCKGRIESYGLKVEIVE
ncbi:MAG: glycyl-radical enzyme activating protein [Dehalococcoidales bacterium]|nr:glycyl-radical enzyme activating protein [Dehalococcoidales bacterium]